MAQLKIIWSLTADTQFTSILKYWLNRNKSNVFSIKLQKLVEERTVELASNPLLYQNSVYKDIRRLPLENYSIYYRTSESELIIIAFWDNRQDPKRLLELLKKV